MIRTFRPTILNKAFKKAHFTTAGFTLIELLVVVSIIGFMAMVALPSVSNFFRVSITGATRTIATAIRESYNATVITGKIHRVVFDLKAQEYWAESGPTTLLLDTDTSREKDERKKRFQKPSEDDTSSSPSFSLEKSITRKKTALPRGVTITDVVTERSSEPQTEGIATSHFFPHGLSERTIVHLKDSQDHQVTLVISPILATTQVMDGYVSEEEVFGKDIRRK